MGRLMGDAIGGAAGILAAVPGLEVVAGYDTGTIGAPPIRWSSAQWALFPGLPQVHIDQGGPGAPVYSATVIDIEPGAWSPDQAGAWCSSCTAPRPTIYVNRSNLAAAYAAAASSPRFGGDVWLAFPGWQQGQPLPVLPAGGRIVAVQNDFRADYDLSVVLDPTWPDGGAMATAPTLQDGWQWCSFCGALWHTGAGSVCPAPDSGGSHGLGPGHTSSDYSLIATPGS